MMMMMTMMMMMMMGPLGSPDTPRAPRGPRIHEAKHSLAASLFLDKLNLRLLEHLWVLPTCTDWGPKTEFEKYVLFFIFELFKVSIGSLVGLGRAG